MGNDDGREDRSRWRSDGVLETIRGMEARLMLQVQRLQQQVDVLTAQQVRGEVHEVIEGLAGVESLLADWAVQQEVGAGDRNVACEIIDAVSPLVATCAMWVRCWREADERASRPDGRG